MKINNLVTDILRGPWLVNPSSVFEYEKLMNAFLFEKYTGQTISRKEVFAASAQGVGNANTSRKEDLKIARVPMRGILPAYGDFCILGADDYLDWFRELNNNPQIGAVVVDVDGPGSSVSAMNFINEFASEKKKPFVFLANACYSGHYWTACKLADHIMAYGNISSGFGSIGVLSTVMDSRKAMEKEGYKVQIIRAPQSTTKAQQAVDFYEGKDEDFIKSLETEMFPMAEEFINDVKALRPNLKLDAEGLFTGSTFNASQSLENGLVDSIGNEKQAIERAQMLMDLQLY